MTIELHKGEQIGLTDKSIELRPVGIGLGWDTNRYHSSRFDLDASAFLLNAQKKTPEENFFVFYNNLVSPDGAVKHTGDNRTGQGNDDDELLIVDLNKIDDVITEILFVITIHEAEFRKQNFGQVRNAYIRIYDIETNQEILRYNLEEKYSLETAIEFGRMYKVAHQWMFVATGQSIKNGLQGLVDKYM